MIIYTFLAYIAITFHMALVQEFGGITTGQFLFLLLRKNDIYRILNIYSNSRFTKHGWISFLGKFGLGYEFAIWTEGKLFLCYSHVNVLNVKFLVGESNIFSVHPFS